MTEERSYRLYIGGEWVEPERGFYDVINPATEQVVGRAPEASRQQVYDAAAAAKAALPAWSATSPAERAEILNRVVEVIGKRADEYAAIAQAETGATSATVKSLQVNVAMQRFRRYAQGALESNQIPLPPTVSESTPLSKGGLTGALVIRQPVGVVTCITSYNNPWANPSGKIAPALAMGNTLVVKPAPQDPLSVVLMTEALEEAGLPAGVVNLVNGQSIEVGEASVDSPDVDMVSFTGSTNVGRAIGAAAGGQMKRVLMELGGKGAAIVFADANLQAAIGAIGTTFSFYSGQICTAPTRVYAERSVYDQVVEGLKAYATAIKVGDPTAADTVVGPVISAAHRDRIEAYIEKGKAEGATLLSGGERPDLDTGFYVAPTLFADCRNDMTIVREEIFGPVVAVLPFDTEEEAIALANDSDFGLINYVWTADLARGYRVARQLQAGTVDLNTVTQQMEAPFGGFKQSGVGRDRGSFGLHAYSEMQAIVWPG
ncbi:MAG TPA: aldehyde dehydrogenase family protein [Mycobacteriales bacterium]|nr:aldehyde dehydrogenase family protein [Mycobacteriales bacterium]